jgi:hypothetical protein
LVEIHSRVSSRSRLWLDSLALFLPGTVNAALPERLHNSREKERRYESYEKDHVLEVPSMSSSSLLKKMDASSDDIV